jgi:hypothetical protein
MYEFYGFKCILVKLDPFKRTSNVPCEKSKKKRKRSIGAFVLFSSLDPCRVCGVTVLAFLVCGISTLVALDMKKENQVI